jgi:DNA-binding transcriptional LysR family regulator
MLHGRMLRYLDVVARVGTIRKAAAELNIASSAINRQIIALEEELGEPIFERMPRRLRLTATGEVLIEHVRETLKGHARTLQRIEALRGLQRGSVSLATTLGLAAGPMARIVQDYIALHPRMQIRVTGAVSDVICNAVLNGDVALGLGFSISPRPGLKTIFAIDVPLGAVMAVDHPLAGFAHLKLRDVVDYPLVMAERTMSLRSAVDLALSRFPDLPPPVLETNSIELMRNFVSDSQAIALLGALDVSHDVATGRLARIPIIDENLHPQTLRLITRTKDPLDATSSHFVQHLTGLLTMLVDDPAVAPAF